MAYAAYASFERGLAYLAAYLAAYCNMQPHILHICRSHMCVAAYAEAAYAGTIFRPSHMRHMRHMQRHIPNMRYMHPYWYPPPVVPGGVTVLGGTGPDTS
jgi:hypothetical protein